MCGFFCWFFYASISCNNFSDLRWFALHAFKRESYLDVFWARIFTLSGSRGRSFLLQVSQNQGSMCWSASVISTAWTSAPLCGGHNVQALEGLVTFTFGACEGATTQIQFYLHYRKMNGKLPWKKCYSFTMRVKLK